MRDSVVVQIRQSLDDALSWCSSRFKMDSLAESLRSAELKPSARIAEVFETGDFHSIVFEVIRKRAKLVPARRKFPGEHPLLGGQLLAFFPRITLSHGMSVPETGGFIDADEVPPWDSWIYPIDDFLISWVPGNLVSAVDFAVRINAEESIKWLSDVNHPFVQLLKSEGLWQLTVLERIRTVLHKKLWRASGAGSGPKRGDAK